MLARILIIENQEPLTLLIRNDFEAAGYKVDSAGRGDDVETWLGENATDIVVLDSALPGLAGSDLCRRLRARPDNLRPPIITLVAHCEEGLRGLHSAADDFLVKPFSVPHLLARVGALLRRARPDYAKPILRAADVELDHACRRVTRATREVRLGPTEFRLLEFLMRSPGRVFSRKELRDGIWGPTANIGVRTVDAHIGRLRSALSIGNRTDSVITVRGAGYAFRKKPILRKANQLPISDMEADHACN